MEPKLLIPVDDSPTAERTIEAFEVIDKGKSRKTKFFSSLEGFIDPLIGGIGFAMGVVGVLMLINLLLRG